MSTSDFDEDINMCSCIQSGMASPCDYHPKHSVRPLDIIKTLQPENWSWHRDPYVCNLTSDAQIHGQTVIFHPTFSFGTAAVRGQKPLTSCTQAYWEIMVPYCYGTSMMFGIGTRETKMRSPIYFEDILGGTNDTSMGLSHKGIIYRDGVKAEFIPPLPERDVGIIGLYFNGPSGTLSYFLNGEPLGTAFYNINTSETWYPMVSSTSQKSQFTLVHMYSSQDQEGNNPSSLLNICISKILDNVKSPADLSKILPPSIIPKIAEKAMQRRNFQSFTQSLVNNFHTKCSRCSLPVIDIPITPALCHPCNQQRFAGTRRV